VKSKMDFLVPDDKQIKELVSRMIEAEQAIQAYMGDQIDAVLDPVKGGLVLLKQAQEALLEEVRYYHLANILQNMKDGIIVTDSGGIITYWNDGASSIHGQKAEDVLGKPLWQLFPDKCYQEIAGALMNGKEGNVIQREWHAQSGDDSGLWVESRMSLMSNVKGETSGYILVERDISERKRADEALRASGERLRHLSVALLSAQEHERKLIANDLHDGLAANLSAIQFRFEGEIEQVKKGKIGPDVGRLEDIVKMIKISIQDTRRIMSNLRPAMLDDLGLLPTLGWLCRETEKTYPRLRIETQLEAGEHRITESVKTQVFRIIQEALHNVGKHSGANLVHLSLREASGRLELTVQDNGKGFQVEEALAKESSARGLGLASMRERAECSGGSFEIESVPGKGTIIRVHWPLQRAAD
jgi:PAS domain S-box-containing protein